MEWDDWAEILAKGADLPGTGRREVHKNSGLYIGVVVMSVRTQDIVIQEIGGGRWVAHRFTDLDESVVTVPAIEQFMEVQYQNGRGVVCGL